MDNENIVDIKHVNIKERTFFFIGVFLFATIAGMVSTYRQAYFVNVLQIPSNSLSMVNAVVSGSEYLLSFLYAFALDRSKSKHGRFRFFGAVFAIPMGLFAILLFSVPNMPLNLIAIYIIIVSILYSICNGFAAQNTNVAIVISPNMKERNSILSLRGIFQSIGSSAPLVVVLVIGLFRKNGLVSSEGSMYLISAIVCSTAGSIAILLAMKYTKERLKYTQKKVNIFKGITDVIKSKSAISLLISDFIKAFRGISNYMGVFLAAVLLGDISKFILLGLPTAIGTFVGMIIIKSLLNKYNCKQLYILSGVYSIVANIIAFTLGYFYLSIGGGFNLLGILFFLTLFLIGIQFGASNLLPSIFRADILEELEYQSKTRLDGTFDLVMGFGSRFSSLIALSLSPLILYGANSIIQYVPPIKNDLGVFVQQEQTFNTKILLLGFYTVFHGLCMFLSSLVIISYDLVGAKKDKIDKELQLIRNQEQV